MEISNNPNQINEPSNPNQNNNQKIEIEEKIDIDTNQKMENEPQTLQDQKKAKEEEKKYEEIDLDDNQDMSLRQKEQDVINEKKAQKQAQLQLIEKLYDDLLKNTIYLWETDKLNYEENFNRKILDNLLNSLNRPCIMCFQDNISFDFKFFCKLFDFLKDNLKEIPQGIMIKLCYLYNYNIFSITPNINNNNNVDSDFYELIGDKLFYYLFKELAPEGEIENPQILPNYNCMTKYFINYLFYNGYNKKYIVDFLSRDDFDFQNYLLFCDYPFQILAYCEDSFIRKNDYNILLIKNFVQKMNYYLDHSQEYIKENKGLFLKNAKNITDFYISKIFGALTRMLDILEENEAENFCFCLFRHVEILLKQQKLELRIFAINQLIYYINIYYNNADYLKKYYNDYKSVYDYTKQKFIIFLQKINIFDLIFGENIHEALIDRSYLLFSFLYKNNMFTPEQISYLWKISQSKHQSISNSIIGLFGKLLPEFSDENCNMILQTVINMNYNEVNEVTLKLLDYFFIGQKRNENLLKILFKYSNELSYSEGLSSNIINKSRNILVKLLFNKIYADDLHQCIKNCLFCIDNNYLLDTHISIFNKIIREFIITEKTDNTLYIFKHFNENIQSFENFLIFLDKNYSMFTILLNYILFMKKIFVFFAEEAIRLKKLINEGNFDFDCLLNIDNLILKYKEYKQKLNNEESNKMDIDNDNRINMNMDNVNNNNVNHYLLPKNKNDIENYLKIMMNDFINYFKNKLLKEKISLDDNEIIYNIFTHFELSVDKNTYQGLITLITNIIFTTHQIGYVYIKRDIFDILYNLLVENSLINAENEIFFNFIKDIIFFQIHNSQFKIITDDDIEYLCLQKISSNDIKILPFSAYEAMNLYIIYINEKNGNITYSKESKKFIDIKKINLFIGFKTLLDFYIFCKDIKIFGNSSSTLTNIIEITAIDMLNRKYILDELFSLLQKYIMKIKKSENNNIEKIIFRRILKLISIVNKTKVSKNLYDRNDPKNILNLNIINNFFFTNNNNIIPFKAFKGLTINELKNELTNSLICSDVSNLSLYNNLSNYPHPYITNLVELKNEIKTNNLIVLLYNSQVLKNDFTLDEYNIKDNDNIVILNGACSDLNQEEFQMNEDQLKDAYQQIKVVFNDRFNEEIMKASLYKQKGNITNAILYLAEDKNVTELLKEIENKKLNEPKKKEELICLEENKFNILLDILNEGDTDLNASIWDLFAQIKFPDILIMNSIGNGFDNIWEEKNFNKQILILKIINSVIFDDETFCKNNKLTKNIKNQWISKFLNSDQYIIKILSILSTLKINNNQNNYSRIIYIIVNWFSKIFKKIESIKNKNNINNTASESIIIDNDNTKEEENKKNEEKKEEVYGKFEIIENEADNFLEILEKNNFISFFYHILGISLEFKDKTEKRIIISNIYGILIIYLGIKSKDIIHLLEEEKKIKKIYNILILSEDIHIRKSAQFFIKKLLEIVDSSKQNETKDNNNNNNETNIDIQSFLLNYFYPELISDEVYPEEFYQLIIYLINYKEIKPNTIPIDKIIEKFLNYIYEIKNNTNNINNNDYESILKIQNKIKNNLYILNCLNPIYSEVLKKEIEKKLEEKKDIISLLYDSLFKMEINEDNNNKGNIFFDDQLRSKIFNFLSKVISLDKKYYDIIFPKIIMQHKTILPKKIGLPLGFPLRNFSTQKFIGLHNFGATCYLNSLFQQMFMIPTFYKDLFSFDISEEDDNLIYSTIYNMQLSFANLKKSCMNFYPLNEFIKSFKTAFNGEPIRLGEQQDTDEFLAILCEKLEKEAKKFDRENFLENSFRGKITNEIVSLEKEYPYYSQTEEPFYRITLEIKGHNNLEDALDEYIKGEILDGDNQYFVEKYNKKISIKKRTSIKKIGNQIIIHLKRFEFDYMTFQNKKLNDYLKFPLTINLKKWTRAFIRTNEVNNNDENNIISEEEKENLNNEKMNYELTGILIHSGASLQSGHYYSFIKDQESGKWYKFNDSTISDYDIEKDLEKECFGNIDCKKNQYGKGAYLLIYTKKECIDSYKKYENNVKINDKIIQQVQKENIYFINVKTFSNYVYNNFLIEFIKCSLNYLKDNKIYDNDKNEKDFSFLMTKQILQEIKISEKLISLLKGNKENNIDLNDEEIKNLPENIEQIYDKCKTEIIYIENDEKKKKINMNNKGITIKNIIKLLYCYIFGIVYQYCDKEDNLKECLSLLLEILQKHPSYSVYIMKLMEKNIEIFIDLLFKYGFIDKDMEGINKTINNLYNLLFDSVYKFEKEKYGFITNKTFYQFVKNDKGKLIVEKEYQSLFLRVFRKIFFLNLEKCRKEYLRESLFLTLFNSIIFSYPESCIVSSNYLLSLISFISNNNIPTFKSQINPNIKMGNKNNNFQSNILYLTLFCNIILRSATPGMIISKKISPFFISTINFNEENPDFTLCPKLPNDWSNFLIYDFVIQYILYCSNNESLKILFHLSFNDKEASINIMNLTNNHLKKMVAYYSKFELIIFNLCEIFNLNDNLNEIRVQTLFELDSNNNNSEETLINFYYKYRTNIPYITVWGIYVFSKLISQYQVVYEYFKKNKTKVEWVKKYYYDEMLVNYEEKTNNNLYNGVKSNLDKFPDLFAVIENEFINKLEI